MPLNLPGGAQEEDAGENSVWALYAATDEQREIP